MIPELIWVVNHCAIPRWGDIVIDQNIHMPQVDLSTHLIIEILSRIVEIPRLYKLAGGKKIWNGNKGLRTVMYLANTGRIATCMGDFI